jgi:hypothetical protein
MLIYTFCFISNRINYLSPGRERSFSGGTGSVVAGGCRRSCDRGYTGQNFVPDAINFCFAHSALSMRNVVIKKE